jgi:Domain of unknown function (DUF4136)
VKLMMRFLMVSALLLLPAVAQAAAVKVEVTRFHLLSPPAPPLSGSSIAVEPADPAATSELQFAALAAVANAVLAKAGFRLAVAGQPADHVARIALTATSEQVRKRSAFSVGIGGGSVGRNGGIGGGASFPIGGGLKTVTAAQMTLQIRRSSDNSSVWEGRASSIAPGIDPISAAPVLLQALLKGFPGANGKAETVKVKTNP